MSETSLRILYVLPYTPSPIRVRPFQIIRHLAQAGHRVTVVALEDEFATEAALAELNECCEKIHIVPHNRKSAAINALRALPTATPLWAAYCHSPAMMSLLRQLSGSGEFDVAHVEHLRATHLASALGSLPVVLDAVDCITALQKQMWQQPGSWKSRLLSWEEWIKLRHYEPKMYRSFSEIAVTSEYDRAELLGLGVDLPRLSVIPNGVDLDYFSPDPVILPESDLLVFSGKMSYHANDDAAQFLLTKVLPLVREHRPGVRLLLVGSKPTPTLKTIAARTGNVTVTGFVEDLRPYLSRATAAVCPMRIGVGIQNKALEAMALARPVVCTPLVARALSASTGDDRGVCVAETSEEFATRCVELLSLNDNYTAEMGKRGRAYVERHHRWQTVIRSFVQLYENAISRTSKTTA